MPGNWPSIRSIEESFATLILPTGDVIDELRHLIDQCDIYRYEAILLTPYLVSFADLFGRKITDDQQLNDFFKQLNETALSDEEFAPKMAFVLASQQLGAHTPHETKVRNAMIETLQHNFVTFQQQEEKDTQRFYNSLTLLGEYYHRKKIGYGQRINILGHALLSMLTSELEAETNKACKQQPPYFINTAFAKLIATQMNLNVDVMKEDHPKEIKELTLMIRRCLITVPNLSKYTKAYLLMAIDMYHSNLTTDLVDNLYDKYIDKEGNGESEIVPIVEESSEPASERKSKKSRSKDRKERKERKERKPVAKESRESTDPDGSSRSGRSERSVVAESVTEEPTQNTLPSDFDLDKYIAKYCPTVYEQISPVAERKSKNSRSKERKEKKTSSSRSKKSAHSKEEHSTDKENKRRPSSRTDDSSPTRNRHHRQNGEGERSTEPANSPPTSPSKKSSPQTTRTITISERSPTREGGSDKLAQLPKITITTTVATTSPPEKQSDSGLTSPRGVLVASAKQPKSPTRDRPARRTILDQQEDVPTKAKGRSSLKSESRKSDRHRRSSETQPSGGGGTCGKNVLKQHGNSTNTTAASKHKAGRDTDTKKDRSGSKQESDVSAKAHGVATPPPQGSDVEQEDSSTKGQEHCDPSTEKVSWYDLMMEDESPQKPNARTESHPTVPDQRVTPL
ncbi:micronuclear linker histone polyprotein [Anopheles bellator]|uniref:micronuclear linker histone polyprotein n=1 Tax=Anopheles bellator TaxID=139047 RepID=UPI00264846BA|nr:micronuclear linker histone polyprotein [Anopheles bellator]